MRFCLRCRSFSGGGPLCTQCGRSFGGRLCRGRTKHLNPYDACFCNYCNTSDLLEGATSIPLGWVSRLMILAVVFFSGRWLLTLSHVQSVSVQSLTGYRDVRIWLIEKFANLLIVLFVFSFLSALIPGEAGRQFRAIMFGVVGRAIALAFKLLEGAFVFCGKLLLHTLGLSSTLKK